MAITIEMRNSAEANVMQDLPEVKMNDSSLQLQPNDSYELPIDMRFNDGHVVTIVTYSILMVISAIGNITVLVLILRMKRTPGKTYPLLMMLMHLAIADLFATFLMMPLEIGWAITVSWTAGDAMCRIMAFFRIFGLYLSSFILVCISIDRYYAIKRPLQLIAEKRRKIMIAMAWVGAVLCSAPQMVVFHLEVHPNVTWYEQCITVNTFSSYAHEVAYSFFGMVMMYWFPLIVIMYTYSSIFMELCRRSREPEEDRIRRSSGEYFTRAKTRTLKISIMIIAVFVVCWTPYYVMSVWYWIDTPSAKHVDQRIQKVLFLFACTNSCMNPIVYGLFNIRDRKKDQRSDTGISVGRPSCVVVQNVPIQILTPSSKLKSTKGCVFSTRKNPDEPEEHVYRLNESFRLKRSKCQPWTKIDETCRRIEETRDNAQTTL